MKRLPLLLILACSILLHAGAISQSHSNPAPNFIFIFADDMAYETIAAHGETDIDTPHLDRLLSRSTSFTRAVSYTHLRAHETPEHLVCRLLL